MTGHILNRQQVRSVDKIAIEQFGMPGMILMENAGRGCVDAILQARIHGPFVICCGRGNNGGDGFVIARHLANLGESCKVLLFADPDSLAGDARLNYGILCKTAVPIEVIDSPLSDASLKQALGELEKQPANCIIDALLGTGAVGEVRAPYDQVISIANQLPVKRVAVDIPSGLDCDTGEGELVFQADLTCTFVASKPGLETERGQQMCGQTVVVDIGVPAEIVDIALSNS